MRVLVACEFSGTVRDAFIRHGHDAVSCDIIDTHAPGPHITDDVLNHLEDEWDLMIAHPPCTYLSNVSAKALAHDPSRLALLEQAATFFRALLNAPIPLRAVENPIMLHRAVSIIGAAYDQRIEPWQFGHTVTKATCLWLRGLPPLMPTSNAQWYTQRKPVKERLFTQYMEPGRNRRQRRSITFSGIADAMAHQWGSYK